MSRWFRNRHDEPFLRFRISQLLLAIVLVAVVSALHDYPRIGAGAGAILIVGYLHYLSLGRTTPLAVVGFVIGGPVVGTIIGFVYAVDESQGKKYIQTISAQAIDGFITTMVCLGLIAAAVVALIVAFEKRDEWFNHL